MKRLFILLFLTAQTVYGQEDFPYNNPLMNDAVYTLFENAVVHQEPGVADTLSLLIYRGKVIACAQSEDISIPENTRKFDLDRKHIYPSFIEMNSAYGIEPLPEKKAKKGPQTEPRENLATYWNEAIHPEMVALNRFSPNPKTADLYRKKGFGYTLSHLQDGIARGSSVLVHTGDEKASSAVVKSEVGMHYSLRKGSSQQDYPSSMMGCIALLRQSIYDAKWYETNSPESVNYSLEAYNLKAGLPKFFAVDNPYDVNRIERLGAEFEESFIIVDDGKAYQQGINYPEHVEAIVAPLNFPSPIDMSDPDLARLVNQSDLLHWKRAPYNPFYIQERELDLMLSSGDDQKEKDFWQNLRSAVAHGLDPDTALAALTTTPARISGMDKSIGKLNEGYQANFFIASGDVFSDPDAEILSHHIDGKAYVYDDPQKTDLTGNYTLNINDNYRILQVKKGQDYKAYVVVEGATDTTKVPATLTQIGNDVSLQFVDPELGRFRLSGTVISDNRIWDGIGKDVNGKDLIWSAIRRKEKGEAKTDTLSMDLDSIPKPPMMKYPMSAYGFDSIPKAVCTLFKNATIWTSDSLGKMEGAQLLIKDGKIAAIGRSINPDDHLGKKEKGTCVTRDLKGAHITPGIIDEHSHIGLHRGVNESGQTSSAEVRISDALNPSDINLYRQLAGGVTTSQLLHGSANPIGGQSAIIKLRWGQPYESMLMEEAAPFIKFALGENVKQSNWGDAYRSRFPQTRMGVEQVFYDMFYRAKAYGEQKAIYEASQSNQKKKRRKSTEPEQAFEIDLELEALSEILKGERFITCHSYVQSEINMLMHVADSMGFTLNTFTHILEGYKLADKMKAHGAAASTFSDWWAYKYEVNDAIPYNASLLNEMGVLTSINSDDAEMGRRLNQEAAKAIKYGGMSEEDALKMVTINPAKMLHIDDYVGSIRVGKHADIVIWTDHPLSIYSKVETTYVDGIPYYDRDTSVQLKHRDEAERAEIINDMLEEIKNGAPARRPQKKEESHYHCDTLHQ